MAITQGHEARNGLQSQSRKDSHNPIKMEQKDCDSMRPLKTSSGTPVVILGCILVVQADTCATKHGSTCSSDQDKMEKISPRLWLKTPVNGESVTGEFSFTDNKVLLEATTLLHTEYGKLRCLPDAEYALWRKAGDYCQVAPLVIHLDGVVWRIIASENASVNDADMNNLNENIMPALRLYIKAHNEGGKLLKEVKEATARGEKDLVDHREFLFKIFSIVGMPPTLSHDLTKTKLLNFVLGRCFHNEGLDVLKETLTFEDCMSLVRKLHLEVENHHPEHGARPAISVLDMYLDRVSRGVQKSHGWNQAAWHIPERYAPAEYCQDFADLEKKYGHLELKDPGQLDLPTLLPGARMDLKWVDLTF